MSGPAPAPSPVPEATVEALIRRRLSDAMGGVRGSLETTVPMLTFVVLWSMTRDRTLSLAGAGAAFALLLLVRVLQRQTPQFVLSGLLAAGLAAFFALRSGRAEDAFLPGILTSVGYGLAAVVSIVVRWPLVGFMVGAADPAAREGDMLRWRRNPAAVRVCSRLTLVLVALFAIRTAVMGPLYLADNVTALAVCKVLLGWPLWVLALAVMGALLVRGRTPLDPDDELFADHPSPHLP